MYNTLLQQYQLVRSARGALMSYCENIQARDLNVRLATCNNESMLSQMMHVANCYVFWLSITMLQSTRSEFDITEHQTLPAMRQAFDKVDLTVNEFLNTYRESLDVPLQLTRPDGSTLTRSPLEIFTHVITHEFHHKGQIVNMGRQLGYAPVDTDVVRE